MSCLENPFAEILKAGNIKRGKQLLVTKCHLNDSIKQKIADVVNKHPDGIWSHYVPEEYKKTYGCSLDFAEYNYSGIAQLLLSIPDVVQCVETENHLWYVYPYYVDLPQDFFIRKPCIPNDLKEKVRKLLLLPQFKNGIKLKDLIPAYEKYYMAPLNVQNYFCDDVEVFAKALNGESLFLKYVNDVIGTIAVSSLDTKEENEPNEIVPEPPLPLTIPDNALQFGESIPEPDLKTDVSIGMQFKGGFADIVGPKEFYVGIDSDRAPMFEFLEEMNDYYKTIKERELSMPACKIQTGQYCVCLHYEDSGEVRHKIWYRARIQKVNYDSINVKLVDFGGIVNTTAENLKFLLKEYTKVPVRIIRCRQTNIKPIEGPKYTRNACLLFATCLQHPKAEARVLFIDHSESCVLVETFMKPKKPVAKILIKKSHALPCATEGS